MMANGRLSDSQGPVPRQHIDEDTCLDLLHDLLPPDERDRILSHLAVCPACERLFQERVAERERLRSRGIPGGVPATAGQRASKAWWAPACVKDLRSYLPRIWAGIAQRIGRSRLQLAGAGIIAAAAVLLTIWFRPGSPPLGLRMLPESSGDIQLRGIGPSGLSEDLMSGLEAYAGRDFERAADLLARAEVPAEYSDFRKIYLASSLAWAGEYREALEVLETVDIEILPDGYRGESVWTLYVCMAKSGQDSRADSLLNALVHEPGLLGERARHLLDQ